MLLETSLCKRVIPCLDVTNERTVKGVQFSNLRDVGDPVELGVSYQQQGADELMFLDISATQEQRATTIDLVKRVAYHLSIPFTVGGGISSVKTVSSLLDNGADKVSVNSAAVARPQLISEIAENCGSQCCVVAIDARRSIDGQFNNDSPTWDVLVNGGRVNTGLNALTWARECVERGAGEILLTSWDKDGTLSGFDINLVRLFSESLPVPVIASGGARDPESFIEVFVEGHADAALAASIFHDNVYTIGCVKESMRTEGVQVRL
jgi:imidazole glycerol-phosphate synthase subunit HisF